MNTNTDTTPTKPTVRPAVLAAAVSLLAAVPEAQRAPFWRLVSATLARLHWYARYAQKLVELTGRPTVETTAPACEGATLVVCALTTESDVRGVRELLDALFVVLLGYDPDALPESIDQRAMPERLRVACAVWSQVARDTGLDAETDPAAEGAGTDPAPVPEDPRFALALGAVRALAPCDRDEFLDAFDAYLAGMIAAVNLALVRETDAALTTARVMAEAAADVLTGAHEDYDATLPNEGDTWETADALAAAFLHNTVKGMALRLRADAPLKIMSVDLDAARILMERVRLTLAPGDAPVADDTGRTLDALRAAVDAAHVVAPEFPVDLLRRAALYAVEIGANLTAAAVLHLAAIQIRHAPAGRYDTAAVARAEVYLTNFPPVEQG